MGIIGKGLCVLALLSGLDAAAEARQPVVHESFFVGGGYAGPASAPYMVGQMYVERLTPEHVTHPYPLVLIHGFGQTAMNWLTTPDGREGWAEWFADHGWVVVMVDQPARGRSAWQPNVNGPLALASAPRTQMMFTAPEDDGNWPQAKLHTQWPGGQHSGHPGNPAFDQFYASQVPSVGNAESERLMRAAGAALLDRIGPAVLLTHSQGGLFGWLIADARPGLVKAIVAVEPSGPPYKDMLTPDIRQWAITNTPLTYDPPVTTDSPLQFQQQEAPEAPGLVACWLQKEPARPLLNLAHTPVLMVTSEASYHAPYDHCTAAFLRQAGVAVDHVKLGESGIHGNAHMMMLEMNNLQIAELLDTWLSQPVK